VAGSVAAFCLYRRVDEEIRRRVESRISEHYRGLKVSIRSAQLVEGKGIRIHDLSIVEPGAEGPCAELFSIEEALLDCSTDWQELVKGVPAIRRVTIRRPVLRLTRRPDGAWSAAKLLPPPKFGDRPPEVVVENGTIEIFDPRKTPTSTLTLRDVNLTLSPMPRSATPDIRQLQGMLAGDGFRRVEFDGQVDLHAATCAVRGHADAIEISPELRDALPNPLAEKLQPLGNLRGQGDLRFAVSYDPAAVVPLKYDLSGRLLRGRVDDPRLPHALSDIRATIHVDNGGYTIDDLAARSGQTILRMSCRRSGFEPTSPLSLAAEVRQLDLDRAVLNLLPTDMQDHWHRYRPAGEVDADVRLSFDGQTWRPEIAVRCLNVSFTHHKFPYRLDHGKGTLDLKNNQVKLSLIAYSGSQPVRLTADVSDVLAEPFGWVEAKGDDIQLDQSLIDALPEKPRAAVRAIDPRGTASFYVRMWRDKPNEPLHEHLLVAPNRCFVRFSKFPYPLSDVRGTLEMLDGNWTFRNLEGSNGKARVTCEGQLTPGFAGNELVLNFVARDVALGDDLRDALSPNIQQVWHDLRPRGTVDLTAEIRYLAEQEKFSIAVRAEPQPDSTSIEPVHFPYRLDHIQSVLIYRDGHLAFERSKAEHGSVKLTAEGCCDFSPDGRWTMHFAALSADRLRIDRDRELIQALPERLRKAVAELNPTGSINLHGSLDFERAGGRDEPLRSRWDVRLGMQQSNLQCGGLLLENVHGEVWLAGGFDGRQLQSRGQLALDSFNFKDCQFTQIAGPIWIDDGRVLLGTWVDRPDNGVAPGGVAGPARTPQPIATNLFGGKLYVNGWVALGVEPRYMINATLTDADLARCAQEAGTGRQNLRGKIVATADLTGSGRTRNTLAGRGTVRLSDGNVYELPVMIALLKILSIRPPNQNAFSAATVEYRIEGEHIYFDRIDFRGDAISLRGKGEMDFQSAIRLTFHAMVGRGELDVPVIRQIFTGASEQIMLIHVDGTLQNPETRKEALPAVNEALKKLRGELENLR
jgi:hypothetical protein